MPRPTIIDRLDKAAREDINRWRNDEGRTIDELLDMLKDKHGIEIKRSTMGLHVQRLDEIGKRIRESRAIAEGLAPTLADSDDGQILNVNIHLMHDAVMKLLSTTDDEGQSVELSALQASQIGKALESAAKAAKINADRVLKIKADAAEETKRKAVSEVGKLGKAKGWSPEMVNIVRDTILKVA